MVDIHNTSGFAMQFIFLDTGKMRQNHLLLFGEELVIKLNQCELSFRINCYKSYLGLK